MSQMTVEQNDPGADKPVDLYREVHKGLRAALFELTVAAGALGDADQPSVGAFVALFRDVDMMLTIHHGHEDSEQLLDLISGHCQSSLGLVERAHERSQAALAALGRSVDELESGAGDAGAIYDAVVQFVTEYMIHMNVEEQQVMPALQQGATAEELMAITMAIRTSVPPPEMCVFLQYMLPAMNPAERADMLGGMQLGAPPEIFDMFWGAATDCLNDGALAEVGARIGR